MDHPLQELFDYPGLSQEIVAFDLSDEFSRDAIQRAQAYLQPGIISKVEAGHLDFECESDYGLDDFSEGEGITVIARVMGSRRRHYKTGIDFYTNDDGEWAVACKCTCPVGYNCKHAAALLLHLKRTIAQGPPATRTPASVQLPRHIADWLRSLEFTATTPPPKPTSQQKFLAYCLEYTSSGKIRFALHPANILKNDRISIESTGTRADLSKPPQYIAEVDYPICIAYHRHPREYDGWNQSVLPAGQQGAALFDRAMQTHRFFFIADKNFHRSIDSHTPITRGADITAELGWETLPSGNARPSLLGLPAHFHIFPTEPPTYLDPHTAQLGTIICEQPNHLFKHWQNGPEISAHYIESLSAKISSIPGASIPAPISVPLETRPTTPPIPHIHISRLHATVAGLPSDHIVGHLSFQYSDSQLLPHPLTEKSPPQHIELRDGKRITWTRDAKLETALAKKLKAAGIIPFNRIISERHLHHSLRPTFVPEDSQPTIALAWLRSLESPALQKLRDQGWTITIDPKSGLTAHDASDFLPAIEADTDHGIDWFRFDVSFEIDGMKRSLIPLIAQAIEKNFPPSTTPDLPEWITIPCENPADGFIRLPARRFLEIVDQVRHLFHGREPGTGGFKLDRLAAAGIADGFGLKSDKTTRALTQLGRALKDIRELPQQDPPATVLATLRPYQQEGFRWLRFLTKHHLNGILADDMGLGKTIQTLTHLAAEHADNPGKTSLVIAPTSVVPNWISEAEKFTPHLKILLHHGNDRSTTTSDIAAADIVVTSYPLLHRDISILAKTDWHCLILDEAQHIKNPKSITAQAACALNAAHRICLSGTPMENHLGELWSLMRFLMPGYLPEEKSFNSIIRKPIERDRSGDAQNALNRRISPLILRRTKDQVATDLPPKTQLIHHIDLTKKQVDLYESVRASMDQRVREAIAAKGLAQSHIIVLDALLKLRQICCHPQLLKLPAAQKINESAKLHFLTDELLPQLLEEGRRILLFSQFTSMLALIEAHLEKEKIPFLKLTGQTKDRATLVKQFQTGEVPIFLISLKAGGTGLNLTAADTVIHYDPWWNPAAENQATDRAHRIGQNKPVFVHKLVCRGTIEDRILELQKHKAALVQALLSEETTSLKIDSETLSHLLEPLT